MIRASHYRIAAVPMTKLPISVFIIAKNEADRIPVSLRAVREWVDEVIVIDSGSEDDTVSVSGSLGARVVFNAWRGYGPQKVFGEGLCRNEWILNIDADEEVSGELREEIRSLFAKEIPEEVAGYRLPVLPLYPFQESGHRWTVTNYPIRLYRKTKAGFSDSIVHDSVLVREGGTQRLKGMLIHRSFRSLSHHLDKINFYTSAQAEDTIRRKGTPSALALILTPPLAFLKSFLLRREFVNGIDGVVISYMYAIQRFMKVAKARELARIKAQGAPYV
jgi:glycosyltransferase involved in cell wall biosynthesis